MDIFVYHFNNYYNNDSDPKIHEEYYKKDLQEDSYEELKYWYDHLIQKAGSYNSREIGKINAVISLLNEKYPNWKVNNQ